MSRELGQFLKKLRLEHDLTQHKVAEKLFIERSAYAYYERSKSYPSLQTIKKLAELYKLSPASFILCREIEHLDWIDAKTGPLEDGFYIVCIKSTVTGYRHTDKKFYDAKANVWAGVSLDAVVTHWMPVPKPPKEK